MSFCFPVGNIRSDFVFSFKLLDTFCIHSIQCCPELFISLTVRMAFFVSFFAVMARSIILNLHRKVLTLLVFLSSFHYGYSMFNNIIYINICIQIRRKCFTIYYNTFCNRSRFLTTSRIQ